MKKENLIKENESLKRLPKQLIGVFMWIMIFLALPTITGYIVDEDFWNWKIIINTSRDIGIFIATCMFIFIKRRMNKKEKEDK